MENKAMIITFQDLNFSGEVIGNGFVDEGIILKPSRKSNVMVWIGKCEIKNVVFPDGSIMDAQEVETLFERLCNINELFN